MSMQMALRPYVTAGIALVGASVIAVAPIAPHPDLHLPTVQLSAAIDNPIAVFTPVVDAAGMWLTNTIQSEIANPFPILHQILTNQITTAGQLLQAVNAGGAALGELAAGLPATLQTAFAKLSVGDINGAIDSVIASGLNPIVALITGVWTPLQEVLQRPFAVGQALVPALFDAGLSLALAAVASTVGIGFDTGLTPLVQQIVSSTQSVLTAITTLNPINVLNAIQHGFADVALNVIAQLDSFTTGTLPFIRDSLVAALQVTPAAALSTVATTTALDASTPSADADVDSTASKTAEGAVTPAADPEPTDATLPAATVPEDDTIVSAPGAVTTTPTVQVTDEVETAPQTEAVTAKPSSTAANSGSTTVTRDSLKAEPGKTGLNAGTGSGSVTETESTTTPPTSETTNAPSTPDNAGAPANSADSGSASDSSSGGSSDSGNDA
jgi:hypothetical protein